MVIVSSSSPEASRPTGLKAAEITDLGEAGRSWMARPLFTSHSLIVFSSTAESSQLPIRTEGNGIYTIVPSNPKGLLALNV